MSSGTLITVASIASSGSSSITPGVDLAGSGGLGFSDDQVPREMEYISIGTPGDKQYRVFHSSMHPLQAEAENVARVFCERKGREMNLLQVTTFKSRDEPLLLMTLMVLSAVPWGVVPAAEILLVPGRAVWFRDATGMDPRQAQLPVLRMRLNTCRSRLLPRLQRPRPSSPF